ncbi:MAG: peptidoglycan DD-metalloendopeptidase family protein [Peptococcaceae bacterium]|nr:peptidoglycan DD-metalloendopeptidase family protein [Peptococcaceae bacterium]
MNVQTLPRWRIPCVMVLVMAGLLVAGLAQPLQAASVDDLNKQLRDKQSNITDTSGQLTALKKQIAGTQDEIDELRLEIQESEKQVTAKEKAYDEAVAKVSEAQMRVELKQAEVAERQAIMRTRARATYEEGKTSTLSMLLQATSFSDLLSRVEYLKCLDDKDKDLLDDLQNRQKELEEEQAKLTVQMEAAQAMKEDAERAKKQLDLKNSDLQASLAQYKKNEEQLIKELDALEKSAQYIEDEINKMQNANQQSGQVTGNGTLTTWPIKTGGWVITSGYGMRLHPIQKVYKMHTGIDISGVPGGSPVLAAGSGKVKRYWDAKGYGNYIIIDHGKGMATLYAHMQSAGLIGDGASVAAGQQIGRVGTTGGSTGNHLHFEVRVNGAHVNPMNYRGQMK